MSHMYLLLQDLEKSGNENKIKILQSLGHLLSSNSEMKDEFHKLGGVSVILKYLDKDDWKIAGNAFHILGFSILQSNELQMRLTTEHIFKTILKYLEQGTVNHKRGSMFLIASIVEGNVPGQILIRESGCLYQLIRLFHEIIQQKTEEEEKSQCLYFLCTAIKMCVHNPKNCENQHQTSLIIPKAITFLDSWFHQAFNSHLTECVETIVPMLVNIILDNPTNQLSFSTYSGIQTLVIGLNALESWQEAPLNIETVKVKIICLLDAAICGNNVNSEQATLLGVIPLLLKMLQNFKDQHKFSLLLALIHLVENSPKSREEFLQANGITAVVVATVNLNADSQITVAANCLLKLCATNVLRDKCNASKDSSQRNIKHHEIGINKCNTEATKQLTTQALALADFTSSKKKNVNNDIFYDRSQRKVSHYEISNDQNNNMQTEKQLVTDEITADYFSSTKRFCFSNEDNPTKHMNKEVQNCELVRSNSDSCFLLNQNEQKILPKQKRESCINDTKGQSRAHYNNSHTQNNKIAVQVGSDINDRHLTEEKSDFCRVLHSLHRDKHIPETSENTCVYRTTRNLMNNTLKYYRIPLQKKHKPKEDTQSKRDQQPYTPKKIEIHPNQHHETRRPTLGASQHICVYSSTKKPVNNSHEDNRLPLQENHSSQELLLQTIPQQCTSRTKEIHLNEVNCPVNTSQNPLVHSSNTSKPSSTYYTLTCPKISHNTCQKEINQQQCTSNTKEFHNEVNDSVNGFLNPLVYTPHTSKPFNTPYSSRLKMSDTHQKDINWQQCTSNTKECHLVELNDSLNTFKCPVLYTPSISKSSNEHCAISHNTCQKEINQKQCASRVKEINPNELNTRHTQYSLSHPKMSCNTCHREIKQQQYASNSNKINPNEVNVSLKTLKNPSLHTPNVSKPPKAHYSSPSSYMYQKEEKQQASSVLQHSTDSIPSVQKSLRSCLLHTIQTPVNTAKRYLRDVFLRNSGTQLNNTDRNKREQDFKTTVHIAEEDTLQGEIEVQESQSIKVDKITCLMERTNHRSPQHEKGIPSPIINQDKEMNASNEQVQNSRSCGVSSLTQREPENKLKKSVCTPVRTAVTPYSSTSQTKNSVRHRRKNLQSYLSCMLRYSKEELNNLVAGVAKYGLDFKAIRRAYRFHRKRTPKDLYLKWRSTFISSSRGFKMPESGQQRRSSAHKTVC